MLLRKHETLWLLKLYHKYIQCMSGVPKLFSGRAEINCQTLSSHSEYDHTLLQGQTRRQLWELRKYTIIKHSR